MITYNTRLTSSQEDLQNLQVKLVSNPQGFNQIDKRWVDKYVELWNIPKDITAILKLFTGETKPVKNNLRDEQFKPVPYLSKLFNDFRQKFS